MTMASSPRQRKRCRHGSCRHRRAAGPRTVDADASALVDCTLPPVAAQLELGLKMVEGWDPDWLPGGILIGSQVGPD